MPDRSAFTAPPPGRRDDRGSATAELAVTLPSLVVVLLLALQVLLAVTAQLRCLDAAAVAARAAARGEPEGVVLQAARAVAPADATVTVERADGQVRVRVAASVRPLGGALGSLPALAVSGRATAADEAVL